MKGVALKPEKSQFLYLCRAFSIALGVRLGLLLVAYIEGRAVLGLGIPAKDLLTEAFNRWDAPHYLRIAEVGYRAEGDDRLFLVFFPLYPLAVRLAHYLIPDYVLAGMAVSFVASVTAGFLLQSLVRLDRDDEEAGRALWYFFLFPTAYFLVVPYSEALFMAFLLGSFLAARKGRWTVCGVVGMLMCATRLQGLAALPALVLEALKDGRREFLNRIPWLLLPPLGFLAYLAINWRVLGDPLAFMEIQRSHWFHHVIPPWESLMLAVRAMTSDPPSAFRTMIFEARLVAFALTFILLLLGVRWLRLSYQIYAWVGLLALISVSWQISLPRYLLALFPLYLILARIGRRPAVHLTILSSSAILMSGLFTLYASGYWAF